MEKNKILVLGKTGMLGHLVFDYLYSLEKYEIFGTTRKELDVSKETNEEIKETIKKYSPDYVVNCIGIINKYAERDKKNTIKINGEFPHLLSEICNDLECKLIHVSSDCYLDSDLYGLSKRIGEVNEKNHLTIRTSIIGPELKEGAGLFHWVMSQEGEANGFINAKWDGVTTLELSKFVDFCIQNKKVGGIIDYRTKESTNKYDLLKLISKTFNKNLDIKLDERKLPDKRNLEANEWSLKSYEIQLKELKEWMKDKKEIYSKYFN